MISIIKLSEIFAKISDDYQIDISLDDLKKSFPELNGNSGKFENNINPTRCLALMSKGERCTRKPKCMKNGLCGIHLNMLEKNGSLPNGKFNEDNNNGASGQSSSDLVSFPDLESKSGKANKSSQSSKSNKTNKKKIDKDVETDDSDVEEENLTKKKQNDKNTLDDKVIKRESSIRETPKNDDLSNSDNLKISENNDDESSEETIVCIKFEIDNKKYYLDEKTSIVYNIESPHSEVGILKDNVIIHLD